MATAGAAESPAIDLSWAEDHRVLPKRPEWRGPMLVASLRRRIHVGEEKVAAYQAEKNHDAVALVSEVLADLREQLERAEGIRHAAHGRLLNLASERWVQDRREACQANEAEALRLVRRSAGRVATRRRLASGRPAPKRTTTTSRDGPSDDPDLADEPEPPRGWRLDSREAIDRFFESRWRVLKTLLAKEWEA